MASKKDMKRNELIIPFIEPKSEKSEDMASMLTTTVPMAAVFTRNKMIGWVAVVFALQSWLAESPNAKSSSGASGLLSVGMAFMSLLVTYLPMFLPQPGVSTLQPGTRTEALAAVPPA